MDIGIEQSFPFQIFASLKWLSTGLVCGAKVHYWYGSGARFETWPKIVLQEENCAQRSLPYLILNNMYSKRVSDIKYVKKLQVLELWKLATKSFLLLEEKKNCRNQNIFNHMPLLPCKRVVFF